MSRRANPALIGGFVLGGAVLAVIAVVVFGSGQLFRDTQSFISFFDGSVSGLDVGSAVRFRGIEVGSVRDVLLDLPGVGREDRDLRIAVVYDLDRESLESRGATARLDNPFDIDTLLALGIRAELATDALSQIGDLAGSPELRAAVDALPGTIERLDRAIGDMQAVLARVDSSWTPMSQRVTQATAQAETTLRQLDETLADVGDVLEGVGGILEPESPLFVQFERAMTDLSGASRALRDLAEYLERNPSSLIRGRPGGD